MTKDQLKAKYSRIASDDSQLTAFKDDLIDGEIPVNDARIPQPEAADANKLLIVDDEDNFVLSSVADAIEGPVEEMIADKADLVGGKVPSSQLPSYVDDVVEYASLSNFPAEGEQGKIYLALDTGLCYRWSGSEYIQVAGSTSVLMFASQAAFPVEGEEGVIYVAEDTNKQFRWTGTAYIELSAEEKMLVHTSTGALSSAELQAAIHGKLLISLDEAPEDAYTLCRVTPTTLVFSRHAYKLADGDFVYQKGLVERHRLNVNITTGAISGIGTDRYPVVTESDGNFTATNFELEADGKKLIRSMNLRKTQDMIANVYDATATYNVGDYCIYQNDLYVCNTAISTAEAWNSSHWTKTNLVKANTKVIQKTYGSTLTEDEISAFKRGELGIIITTGITPQNQGPYFFAYTLNNALYGNTSTAYVSSGTKRIMTSQLQILNNYVYVISDTVALQVALTFNATVPAGTTTTPLEIIKDGNIYYEVAPQAMTAAEIEFILQFGNVDHTLANNSWETIAKVCEAGKAADYWALGDTKTDLGTDGTTRTFRICDMQGLYGKHAVFEQVELEAMDYMWNPSSNKDSDNCYNDYAISEIRTTHLPAILTKYSLELQASITNTTYKVATNGNNSELLDLTDKLFLPAEREIFASRLYSRTEEWNALTRYALYATNDTANFKKKYKPGSTSSGYWCLRSPCAGYTNCACGINKNGVSVNGSADATGGVAPCFSF